MVVRWSSLTALGLLVSLVSACPEPGDERGEWGDWYDDETGDAGNDTTSDGGGVETGEDARRPPGTATDETGGDEETAGDETAGDETTGDGDDPSDCIDRMLPEGSFDTVIFDNTIGRSDDSLGSCGLGDAPDFQVGFVAPWAGAYTFDSSGSSFDTVVYVNAGACGDEELGCNDDFIGLESRVTVELGQNQLVTVSVDGTGPFEQGPVELRISEAVQLVCDSEKIAGAVPQQIAGDTSANLDELASGCGGAGAPEQVFEFNPPGPGTYRFDTVGSSFDTVLYALDDCAGAPLACNDDWNFQLQSELTLDLGPGEKVLVVVDGHGANDFGDFVLNVQEL